MTTAPPPVSPSLASAAGAGPPAADPAGGTVATAVSRFIRDRLGCDRLFTVPGEAFLPLLAAASGASTRLVTTRHEAGAGFAAIADARLRAGPAVVAVNRSPGATNVSIALDSARADPTPVLCVVGGARRGTDPRTGFQGTDLTGFLGGLVPTAVIDDPGTVAATLARAEAALTGTVPGPFALVVPEDVWTEPATYRVAPPAASGPVGHPGPAPGDRAAADRVADALARADRPVLLAGRLLRYPVPALGRLAGSAGVPVLTGNKCQDLLDNRHPRYAGHLHLGTPAAVRQRLAGADLVVVLADLPDEIHLAGWHDGQPMLVVHPDPAGPGEHLRADPTVVLGLLAARAWPAIAANRAEWLHGWQALRDALSTATVTPREDGIDFTAVAVALDEQLPHDAVVTLDAGNFSSWIHRYLRLRDGQRLLALAGGAMGFGVPAAVAAALRRPGRPVVAIVGDGGLLMTGNEVATARAAGARLVIVVADNGSYGTIRAHQARQFPGVDCGTALANPDLVAWAGAFGLRGERVDSPQEVPGALRRALASVDGYLLQVRTSLTAIHANHDLAEETTR